MSGRILLGDVRNSLKSLPDGSVNCCVTSPPYFGLRSYLPEGHTDKSKEFGLEATPDAFVAGMVELFREVRRVLRDDGTLWLNLGDSYAANHGSGSVSPGDKQSSNAGSLTDKARSPRKFGLKSKDLIGIPWRVAFALQADGWYLRQDIIWHKPNPMPESVRDRCTKAHEYIFILSKSPRYYYDHEAIKTPAKPETIARLSQATFDQQTGGEKDYQHGTNANRPIRKTLENLKTKLDKQRGHGRRHAGFNDRWDQMSFEEQRALGSNKRSVWTVSTKPFKGAHFATFPPDLIEPCILAGCPEGGTVLDPFFGAGTTGLVAERHGRNWIGCELNPAYIEIAERRIAEASPQVTQYEIRTRLVASLIS